MDTMTGLRVYERLEGRGQVYDGERVVAEVDYSIRDVEETPAAAPAGQRNIYGLVKSSHPQVRVLGEYVGARLALQLHDGRLLHFTVAKVLTAHAFLIQGLGGFR